MSSHAHAYPGESQPIGGLTAASLPNRRRRIRSRIPALSAIAAVAALLSGGVVSGSAHAVVPATPAVAAPTTPEPVALTGTDVTAWLDGLVPAALTNAGIAGATVSVVSNGEVLTSRGYGLADRGTKGSVEAVPDEDARPEQPVDPDETLFRVGSVSKLFTATAVMQLVERGELDLDRDVDEYIDFDLPRHFDTTLTLRHLLSHTAGFEERIAGIIGYGDSVPSLRDVLATDPPEQVYEPGTVPAYSNYGNALAGYIVERASGMPFAEYVESNVLEPVGMTSSRFAQPLPAELADRMAKGYASGSDVPTPFEMVPVAPAGALAATATDMARFMISQLGDGPQLLEPDTLEETHSPALGEDSLGTLAAGPRMALGFFDESRNGTRIIGHGGDTNVFHSHLQLYPDDGAGIFISLNSSGNGPLDDLNIRETVMTGFADRYFPGEKADAPASATAANHAAQAAGTYTESRAARSTFAGAFALTGPTEISARNDGTILVSPAPLSLTPAVFEEIEPWLWQEVGGDRQISMRAESGQVTTISYDSAFALLRVDTAQHPGIAVPVLLGSATVLLLAVLLWPISALVRRHYRVSSAPAPRSSRVVRLLTRVAAASTLLALAGWIQAVTQIMELQDVPTVALRGLQALQLLGVLGVIPAALTVTDSIRSKKGWIRIVGWILVLAALVGVAWFALTFNLIAPSVSY
ncbi:CubicO group peptidase (beta-lactamase class C family)/protein-S-isoprenylcysteine O-methyltransferase Ste14 [Okibacterium sp. HSC-33S16]|uniref:serine hydrolase domain-containing protein n=1 Tax=Okibacterium sp. HSC-33S16 TaxID=2910965 RepID=UPI0020A16CB3|nr:serine hydrolase domain-containing protein [Okibacterium sp. HSC-33S16]MCP2030994.1 CubicO group peptidase (beta-lactamase class C family)/protein-S-isoprenylcysteine O-methyltransferase Ste14 [Okibacterium sp. HSC-33S16]